MAEKILGYGAQLMLGDAESPEGFDLIPSMKDWKFPTGKASMVDVTTHDSPARTKESIAGLLDTGSFGVDIIYDPANVIHQELYELKELGEERNYQVILPDTDSTTFELTCVVTEFEIGLPVDKELSASVTFEVSGAVTLVV